jgi:hypothetical protein
MPEPAVQRRLDRSSVAVVGKYPVSHINVENFMRRNGVVVSLLVALMLSISLVPLAFSQDAKPAGPLVGSWKITHRPVNDAGKPCPFLPDSIEISKDQTLVMSNVPSMHMPFKTDLTQAETQAFEARSESFKGKSLLLIKPNPKMDWRSTPMVYIYSISKDGLMLTAQGWEPATYKRVK